MSAACSLPRCLGGMDGKGHHLHPSVPSARPSLVHLGCFRGVLRARFGSSSPSRILSLPHHRMSGRLLLRRCPERAPRSFAQQGEALLLPGPAVPRVPLTGHPEGSPSHHPPASAGLLSSVPHCLSHAILPLCWPPGPSRPGQLAPLPHSSRPCLCPAGLCLPPEGARVQVDRVRGPTWLRGHVASRPWESLAGHEAVWHFLPALPLGPGRICPSHPRGQRGSVGHTPPARGPQSCSRARGPSR